MSHLVIGEVSEFLRKMLSLGIKDRPGHGNRVALGAGRSPRATPARRSAGYVSSLWLYQIVPNEHLRNPADRPAQQPGHRRDDDAAVLSAIAPESALPAHAVDPGRRRERPLRRPAAARPGDAGLPRPEHRSTCPAGRSRGGQELHVTWRRAPSRSRRGVGGDAAALPAVGLLRVRPCGSIRIGACRRPRGERRTDFAGMGTRLVRDMAAIEVLARAVHSPRWALSVTDALKSSALDRRRVSAAAREASSASCRAGAPVARTFDPPPRRWTSRPSMPAVTSCSTDVGSRARRPAGLGGPSSHSARQPTASSCEARLLQIAEPSALTWPPPDGQGAHPARRGGPTRDTLAARRLIPAARRHDEPLSARSAPSIRRQRSSPGRIGDAGRPWRRSISRSQHPQELPPLGPWPFSSGASSDTR